MLLDHEHVVQLQEVLAELHIIEVLTLKVLCQPQLQQEHYVEHDIAIAAILQNDIRKQIINKLILFPLKSIGLPKLPVLNIQNLPLAIIDGDVTRIKLIRHFYMIRETWISGIECICQTCIRLCTTIRYHGCILHPSLPTRNIHPTARRHLVDAGATTPATTPGRLSNFYA